MTRRLLRLVLGLALYGAGDAVAIRADLGVDPWTVFAQGISQLTGIGVGWVTNIVGLGVLLLWWQLRQRPGIGTVANILILGTCMQATLAIVPPASGLLAQLFFLATGIVLVALATGIYIGASLGAGPRDGLMTGLAARTRRPLWLCRGAIEITVLIAGWLLGGTVGIGTVIFALAIGPLVHVAMRVLKPASLDYVTPRSSGDRAAAF